MPPLHDCKQSNHRQPPAHCRVAPHCRRFVLKADNEVKWGLSAFASLLVGVCPQLHRDVRFGVRVAQGRALRGRNKARNPSLTAVRANALSPLSPRGLSGLCHTVHPVGGEHGSKKLKIALLLIDSKRVYACSSQMLSHR